MHNLFVLLASILSLSATSVQHGESVTISYQNTSAYASIWVCQDACNQPLQEHVSIPLIGGKSGQLQLSAPEPGNYRVRYMQNGSVLDSASFVVKHNELSYPQNGLSLFVLSDPHVLAPSLYQASSESFVSMMQTSRKMFDLSLPLLTALVDSAINAQPDVVLIPGDLTKDGERASHQMVAYQLSRLAQNGIPVFVIPGNHDINNASAYAYTGDARTAVESVDTALFASIYANYGYANTLRDTASLSYVAQLANGISLLAIDASHGTGAGALDPATLQWVLDRADEATARGDMLLSMMHFQLLEHGDGMGTAASSAFIADHDSIAQLFIEHGIHNLLTGHFHVNNITVAYDSLHTDSIVEITTGAPITYPCPYRWITINADRNTLDVETRFILSDAQHADMLRYSHDWMQEHTHALIPTLTAIAWSKRSMLPQLAMAVGMSQAVPTINKFIKCMPQTAEGRAALVDTYLGATIVDCYLLHSEGNEQLRYTDSLRANIKSGILNMAMQLVTDNPGTLTTKDYLVIVGMATYASQVPTVGNTLSAFFGDYTHYGSDRQNQTNDLYASLHLPMPSTPTRVDNPDAGTPGKQSCPAEKILLNGRICILQNGLWYDLFGTPIHN